MVYTTEPFVLQETCGLWPRVVSNQVHAYNVLQFFQNWKQSFVQKEVPLYWGLFTTSETGLQLFRQKFRQRISVMKTNTVVFVVIKTKVN